MVLPKKSTGKKALGDSVNIQQNKNFMVYLLFFFQLNFYFAEYLQNHPTLSSLWTFWVEPSIRNFWTEPSITGGKLGLAIGLIVLYIQTYLILFLSAKEFFKRSFFAFFVKLGKA